MAIIEAYLTPNDYSRTQKKLACVNGIVVHWFANPNSTGMANRNFFEDRKLGQTGYGAAHDIIDLNGDLIKCLPYDEEAYQVGSSQPYMTGISQIYTPKAWQKLNTNDDKNIQPYPNNCTIGVECAHLDWDGNMTPETYETLMFWCVEKLMEHNLTIDDLYLHKEIVGWKDCHMFFVKNPDKWIDFKNDVDYVIKIGGVKMLQQQIQVLTAEVAALKEYNSMSTIPPWSINAVQAAQNKVVTIDGQTVKIMNDPNGRSFDMYALVTMMHRLGLF